MPVLEVEIMIINYICLNMSLFWKKLGISVTITKALRKREHLDFYHVTFKTCENIGVFFYKQ